MLDLPAPSSPRSVRIAPSAGVPGAPPARPAEADGPGAPLTPDVRVVLIVDPAGRHTGTGSAPAAGVPIDEALEARLGRARGQEVLALVGACTGRSPIPCSSSEARSAVSAVPGAPTAGPILLLGAAAALPDIPAGVRASALSLEELASPDGPDRLAAALLAVQHPPRARTVCLVGARGGLGTSVFLLQLARACTAAGSRVAVLDADPAGGLGLLIGDDVVPGLRWGDLPAEEAAFLPGQLVPVLPTWLGMPVLTGDSRGGARGRASIGPALEALQAAHDLVLVDLPRGGEPPQRGLVLLVVGLDLRSAVAAEALAARARTVPGVSVALAARLVGEDVDLDELEVMVQAPVVVTIPHDRAVIQRVARGDDPTRSRGASRRRARDLAAGLVGGERPW